MWPERFGEEKFGKTMLCFICAVSEEQVVILSVMKRAQTDSGD